MSIKANIKKVYGQRSIRDAQAEYVELRAAFDKAEAALNAAGRAFEEAAQQVSDSEVSLVTQLVNKINAEQLRTEVGHSFVTLESVDLAADGTIEKRYPNMLYVKAPSKLFSALPGEGSIRSQLRALRAKYLA